MPLSRSTITKAADLNARSGDSRPQELVTVIWVRCGVRKMEKKIGLSTDGVTNPAYAVGRKKNGLRCRPSL